VGQFQGQILKVGGLRRIRLIPICEPLLSKTLIWCHAEDMAGRGTRPIVVKSQGRLINATPGSTVSAVYAEREVRVFGILEGEATTLSMLNTLATTFFSWGFASFSIAAGIWIDYSYATTPTAIGDVLSKSFAPFLIVLSVGLFGVGIWAVMRRGSIWKTIKEESVQKASIV
jgi:hypothetical protein